MSHTPGTWEHGDDYSIYTRGRKEGDLRIATVSMTLDDQDLANARLIAAAPDMLEALEFVAEDAVMKVKLARHVALAIAKARGE